MCNGLWSISEDVIQKRVKDHDDFLVEKWNSVVSKRDTVYHLGDFAFKNHGRWINALNGKKVLIRGNHDSMSQDHLRCFTQVFDLVVKNIKGKTVTLCHYPLRTWDEYGNGGACLHGHSHGRLANKSAKAVLEYGLLLDVGVDVWDFKPISWETIVENMREKQGVKNV